MAVIIFFLMMIISVGYFLYEVTLRYRFTKLGRQDNRYDRPWERWKYFFANVIMQKKVREHPLFGLFHLFITFGFLILLVGMPNMITEGLFNTSIHHVWDNFCYLLLKDIFVALIVVGVSGALMRRIFRKPEWLKNNIEAFTILGLILVIALTEVFFHGTRFASGEDLALIKASPLALASSKLFINLNQGAIHKSMTILWWTHFLAVFSLCFMVPRSKHLHLVFAPFNVYWHTLAPKGALNKIQVNGKQGEIFGVNRMEDFTWKQLFDAYSCSKCGRCNEQCPAILSGEALKPKALSGRLRKHIEKRAPLLMKKKKLSGIVKPAAKKQKDKNSGAGKSKNNLAGEVFEPEFIWSCTTCGACMEVCPVSIEHTSKIIDLRRYLILTEGNLRGDLKQIFDGIAEHGNPWGYSRQDVPGWAKELAVPTIYENPEAEYLYYAGCAAAFDETAQKTAAALVKILKAAGVNFAVLGSSDWCCGDTPRRMGNEFLFEKTVHKNISTWNKLGIKKIITTCPHCFNTLQNEYPQYGGEYEIIPHAVFLAGLLREGKLPLNKGFAQAVSYHDPCYLGRYNDLFSFPREVLQAVSGVRLIEMPRSQKNAFCCGAGGGRIWTLPVSSNLIAQNRVKEAISTEAEVIGTGCPFCKMIFSEAIELEGSNKQMQVLDIAEIVALGLLWCGFA